MSGKKPTRQIPRCAGPDIPEEKRIVTREPDSTLSMSPGKSIISHCTLEPMGRNRSCVSESM